MHHKWDFNPTPISKLFVVLFLSFNITTGIAEIFTALIVVFIALFFALNSKVSTAIKTGVFYITVLLLINNLNILHYEFIQNYIVIFLVVIKIFFRPIFAAKFLIETSDVSSLIVSFEKMKFPKSIVIALAVIFRYFPAFKEDKKNIQMAMKMRGITFKNPIKYLEYVSVPLLISAVNISDDISKAAETKCIADPCKKTRYHKVQFSIADFVFLLGIISLQILGRIYA